MRRLLAVVASVALLATMIAGCSPAPEKTNPEPPPVTRNEPASGDRTEVLMLGRSVMRGWFDHWGYDGSTPVTRDGYALTYAEVESPPEIARSAARLIADAPDGSVVFFKLCFVDFEAYSQTDADARLAENIGYAEDVIAAARDHDLVLILGNALPRVATETTPELRNLHERYNSRLAELAKANENIVVFDLYGPLSSGGVLREEFAASPGDSHLNEAAYTLLDTSLFAELDRITDR